ncbi:uncharacterized protein LOC123037190 [Drosophila rhopaloa]|uniref:Integrase catalytic domain-containing protein n=1 Tax=Drosophila rhopaloa TaxID=1041015 RepID=A0ABM5J1N6_DRORH|nr:uncharacterized protein LOC123037190 [Drosophila rhopaloa]
MHQLSYDEEDSFPIGAKIVRMDFYVDDLISGGESIEECSNDGRALEGESDCDKEKLIQFHDGSAVTKALGLAWDPSSDQLLFNFSQLSVNHRVTKRIALSTIAKFYDPLGLITPIVTKAKIFLQSLWNANVDWDDTLPEPILSSWGELTSQLSIVQNLKFSRFVMQPQSSIQLHGFCDASIAAYGACLYLRSEANGEAKVHLLCAKSRVSPLKALTIPRLELSAALLLAELIVSVKETIDFECDFYCWSDSSIVLAWIRQPPRDFNVFVSNRIAKIQEMTKGMTWHHVPTSLNPADVVSRGCTPRELLEHSLWANGPPFLLQSSSKWPSLPNAVKDLPERRSAALVGTVCTDISINCKFLNPFHKLQRVFAYIYRFISNCRAKSSPSRNRITVEELNSGTVLLLRSIQQVHLAKEYGCLSQGRPCPQKSKLISLRPIIGSDGLLRVGGRLQNANLDYDTQHPILLPKDHPVTKAIIVYFHIKYLHAGSQALLATLRQRYWPIGGRKFVATVINKCVRCFRMKPVTWEHVMGSLPANRVQPNPAFHTTGVDYCGPFYHKAEARNKAPHKCYIAVFVCFSTKATHLEVVQDLTTDSFIAALRRFTSLRGTPRTIWSDNATNFVGAKSELTELKNLFLSEPHTAAIASSCLADGIDWKFIPPRAPHFGGLLEAAVKSAKFHFYRVVGASILGLDELRTLAYEISAILNSRPLCPISENAESLDVLTPAHFLKGSSYTRFPEPDITHLREGRLSRWQRVTQMQQQFWKRWSSEYLSLLQERSKWRVETSNIKVGSIVLLKEDKLPLLKWQLGCIQGVVPGEDGVVRVAMVRTATGLVKRAVAKLAVLPIDSHLVGALLPPTGGDIKRNQKRSYGINWQNRNKRLKFQQEQLDLEQQLYLAQLVSDAGSQIYDNNLEQYDDDNKDVRTREWVNGAQPPASDDFKDLNDLTPAHLLIGTELTSSPQALLHNSSDPPEKEMRYLDRWQRVTYLKQEIWSLWHRYYVHNLQQRTQAVGQLVTVHENNIQAQHCLLARVVSVTEGHDGKVRDAEIKTVKGLFKRPVHKLARLPE